MLLVARIGSVALCFGCGLPSMISCVLDRRGSTARCGSQSVRAVVDLPDSIIIFMTPVHELGRIMYYVPEFVAFSCGCRSNLRWRAQPFSNWPI